jgi:glycosyltransferase involved in cell wall biosynthesis
MGGQKGIALFCKYLGMQNELTTVSIKGNDISAAENYIMIPLFTNKRIRYASPFYVSRIKKIIKQKNIRNVITEHPYMAWMGWILKKSLGIKWFVHSHNIEFERFKTLGKKWYPLLKVYETWAYKNAHIVLFKTEEDKQFAIDNKMVKKENSFIIPFGVEIKEMPFDKLQQKQKICQQHNVPSNAKLIFFNGAFNYKPNTDALLFILNEINPLLLNAESLNYKIIICGRDLPASFNNLESFADKNIIYAGFVDDVYAYFKAADIFLNPIVSGGGVKTKIVEAMGYGTTVISCISGAAGIETSVCGEKIKIVADNDAIAFANKIIFIKNEISKTPHSYYEYYYWENIVKRLQPLLRD